MNFPFYRIFPKENATSFLKKSFSPFSLQELKPMTPLKATYRFTSLKVIEMKKIMCNNWLQTKDVPPNHRHHCSKYQQ
jgi:hypothetical protein